MCLTSTILHEGLLYWFVGTVNPLDPLNLNYDFGKAVYWPITWPIYMFAFNGNASMTVLLCVERFIVIIYPEKSKIWCSKKRTLLYTCVATIISSILTIPHFFAFTWDNDGKVKPNLDFWLKYAPIDVIADFLSRSILPTVILITLSTIVAIKVYFQYCFYFFTLRSLHYANFILSFLFPVEKILLNGKRNHRR